MTIQIIRRHMVGGRAHEHIAEVEWQDVTTGRIDNSSREIIVRWLDENPKVNIAIVKDPQGDTSWVGTIHPSGGPAYLRTHADGKWNDNLLALDTY